MNGYLKWYGRFAWIGIAFNVLGFILPALFMPDLLEATLGFGSVSLSYVWVAAAGLVLLRATLLYIPAALDPLRYPVYAWLSVVGRVMASAFWLWQNFRWDLPGPIRGFFLTDGFFAVVFLILLYKGMPPEHKFSASLRSILGGAGEAGENRYLAWFGRITWLAIVLNAAFALPALVAPAWLAARVGGTSLDFTYLWLGNVGMLLLQISLFLMPLAKRPVTYHVHAWIFVLGQVLGCVFWFWQLARWGASGPWLAFALIAGLLAAALAVTLHRGLPAEYRFGGANLQKVFADMGAAVSRAFSTPVTALLTVAVLAVGGLLLYGLWANLVRAEPDAVFDDPAMQYKYGAVGLGVDARVPYYLFQVLPEICPDRLPGPDGWASLGILFEEGQEVPVGFAKRQIGYPTVEPTCSLCHTGSYRTAADGERELILGGPAHELDLQAFQWFLYDCASDPRFTTDALLEKIERVADLSWFQKQLYRYVVLPVSKAGLLTQKKDYAWQKSRPTQGRGRTDTFNPTKIVVFHQGDDGTIGTVDLPAIWNQRAREGMYLHWDGNNNDITERNYAAAMAVGATPYSVIPDHFEMVTDFVLELPPPKFPFPVDEARAERGWGLFQIHCADCHAFGSAKVGTVTAIDEIGTDRHRLDSFTEDLVEAFHTVDERQFKFNAYRKTEGYSNLPIDGTWARAPYLHNGSVPTLRALLSSPEERPKTVKKGCNLYDPNEMGFVCTGDEPPGEVFTLDTSVDGNGNGGHAYGIDLSDEEKGDLIEYLKTL